MAQSPSSTGTFSGLVLDPSGARIPNATLRLTSDSALAITLHADRSGAFVATLPVGRYNLIATAVGFQTTDPRVLVLTPNTAAQVILRLTVAAQAEIVDVPSQTRNSTSAADNKSAIVLGEDRLAELSDDNALFQQQLLALTGGDLSRPADIYIDGFTGGRFPPKSAIREVRVNQSPFSAQYSSYGSNRIEVFTKPGGEKFHGNLFALGNNAPFNARNPYTTLEPPYYSYYLDGFLSGPFIDKKTSFFAASTYHKMQNNSVVDSIDPNTFSPFSQAISTPDNTQTYNARIDRQISANNTFTSRYDYRRETLTNAGVGQLTLLSEAYSSTDTRQTIQLGDTQMVTPNVVNEARFQYMRTRVGQNARDSTPTIIVEGSFNAGGSPVGIQHDNQDRYEFIETLSVEHSNHFVRTGARYTLLRDANESTANYNGTYTFPDLLSYKLTQAGATPAQIQTVDPGVTTQFTLTAGQPNAVLTSGELGAYVEDEWKVAKPLTINLGLRFETQTAIPDHADWAPRLGFAWAAGKPDKPAVVLRLGAGIFYERFLPSNLLTTVRQNGVSQQTVTLNNPPFNWNSQPNLTNIVSGGNATPPIPYRLSPSFHTEYDEDISISAERSLGKIGSIATTYIWAHGPHQYLSENINAPLPGTYDPANTATAVRPLGGSQNIYQFCSNGIAKAHLVTFYGNLRPTKRLSMFAFYVWQNQRDNFTLPTAFASNSYDLHEDYGRSARIPHQRLFVSMNLNLPGRISLNPFIAAGSGLPFNITTGNDLNGDTIFNDRPAFATDLTRPSVVRTAFGNFDTAPLPGQRPIPINYGNSPNYLLVNFSLGKTIALGPTRFAPATPGKPASKGQRPFSLKIGLQIQNALNAVNPAPPIGVLTSPLFGKSLGLLGTYTPLGAANRVINLSSTFSF